MEDPQQTDPQLSEQPQDVSYPYFPMSPDGLGKFHQEFGRLAHAQFEQGVTIDALKQRGGRVIEESKAFAEKHGPDKCRPVEAPAEGTVAAEDAPVEPTPLKAAAGRNRGG